jgi:broad specificity phosphatase PhoE
VTTFYLIRHGERSGDQHTLVGRTPGLSLTPRGREQAARLGRHLAHEPITHVFSSPMERARETAELVAAPHQLKVEVSTALTEIDGGEWTGRTFGELDPLESWRHFNAFRSAGALPGAETTLAVLARFVGEMLRLRAMHPNGTFALVSHGDPIKYAVTYFLGAPLDYFHRIEIGLASATVIALDGWNARVLRVNDVPRESV